MSQPLPKSPPQLKVDNFYEFRDFRVPKYRIEFKGAHKLSDVPGYVWYTPAMLYLWGQYTDSNLADMVSQFSPKFFWYQFSRPIFKGLELNGDRAWNHTLWAAKEDEWPKIVDHVLETVQLNLNTQRVFQYALQKLTVVDPLQLEKQATVTTSSSRFDIRSFAVLSNERQCAFNTSKDFVLGEIPAAVSFKPQSLHVRAARRLFSIPNITHTKALTRYKEMLSEKSKPRK